MEGKTGIIAAMALDPASSPSPLSRTTASLPRRGLERLDLMLLASEALDLNGAEAMLWLSEQLGYSPLFPSRVELWKRRCHNPLRRSYRRGGLSPEEADALIRILSSQADRLYPLLRALLSSAESTEVSQQRWNLFESRLAELLQERMNPRRSGVQRLLDPSAGAAQRRQLIQAMALGAGVGGFDRLKASLMDAAA